jgi:hypothetical protein
MRAWEVEELACVRDWMYRVYASVRKEGKGLVHEADMEVERDELRCFMMDTGDIEERARGQVQVRGMYPVFGFLFVTGEYAITDVGKINTGSSTKSKPSSFLAFHFSLKS